MVVRDLMQQSRHRKIELTMPSEQRRASEVINGLHTDDEGIYRLYLPLSIVKPFDST